MIINSTKTAIIESDAREKEKFRSPQELDQKCLGTRSAGKESRKGLRSEDAPAANKPDRRSPDLRPCEA